VNRGTPGAVAHFLINDMRAICKKHGMKAWDCGIPSRDLWWAVGLMERGALTRKRLRELVEETVVSNKEFRRRD
jgi:Asp-tRNA(Asn)/Glu-tRNA(Gln) amidotransferase B subunit